MGRAACLLAVLKREETRLMTETTLESMPEGKIHTILTELLRRTLARIIAEQDAGSGLSDADIDARIHRLEKDSVALKRMARRNDFAPIEPMVAEAAVACNIALGDSIPHDLGRRAVDLIRQLMDLEGRAADGEDARTIAEPLVGHHSTVSVDTFVTSPQVSLSACWSQALKMYPSKSMKGNIDAIAKLALAYFGDVPAPTIRDEDQENFFAWMARLPKDHGKRHGKNRFCRLTPKHPEKYQRTKDDEIAIADLADEEIMRKIRSQNHLSNVEKRALLAEQLTPRLTMQTLKRNRDGLSRMFRAAKDLGCKDAPDAISYKAVGRAVAAAAPDDPLYVRVTRPKLRMPWTEERLRRFLTSPIYTGCFSEHRRWRPGTTIIRDSLYWVPLIVLTIGSRIEEILLLKRSNFVRRNGVDSLAIGLDCDQGGKTEDASRVIPIPQSLLDLGFADWIRGLGDAHGPLLFPEAARRSEIDDLTGPFSKALNRILDALGLGDFDEDFYALRKTLNSMLSAEDVAEGQRQAIAGHKAGTILNRHYTAHRTKELKAAVDRADFQLRIEESAQHGFPVITGCSLSGQDALAVDVTLDDAGEADEIRVINCATKDCVFAFERRDAVTGKALSRADLRKAARCFNDIVGKTSLVLPKHHLKRLAVEHFHALG
ncbi:MAG: integrase [Limimaricola cinnabarinus]|jgi:integrase